MPLILLHKYSSCKGHTIDVNVEFFLSSETNSAYRTEIPWDVLTSQSQTDTDTHKT